MISTTTTFNTAMAANNRIWKLKATITRNIAGATAIDISDRIISSDISFDWERRSASASLELDNYDYALSPLNQASTTNQVAGVFDPLLDSNHKLEIWEGLVTTAGIEYIKKFTGMLGDEIDASTFPNTVQVTCRDMSKLLQDTYIYQSKTYTSTSNALSIAEVVIQDMITQFLPSPVITLSVDAPTLYNVGTPDKPYTAQDINLWDAIQQISDVFSFSIMFDESGILRMKNIIRDFSAVTSVKTFDESEVIKDSISISDSDVRNHVMLRVQGLDPIEVKNDASIAKYGRRYFEVHRSMSNIISTAEQGHTLVANILRDLSYIVPDDKIEMPLYPQIQTGDIVSVSNQRLGTSPADYKFRITRLTDSFSKDKKRTSLTLSGYTVFNPSDTLAPNAPTGMTGTNRARSVQNYAGSGWVGYTQTTYYPLITWTPPSTNTGGVALTSDFGGYTLYRKGPTDASYFPIANFKSYISATSTVVNYFNDYTAVAGTNLYKLVAISKFGKVSAFSSVLTLVKPNVSIV